MEENIEVVPSEESGNVPAETPSEQPKEPATPAEEPKEPVQPTEPTAELYELPDGRKVDGETLSREWKENFAPEFTRRSQELAKLKEGTNSTINNNQPVNQYEDPEWQPQSYAELLQVAEERALRAVEAKELARIEQTKAIENEVITQLDTLKKADPTLNENALFLHANKYGFRDLSVAYQNMKDMSELAKKVQTTTAQNIAKRVDPVSVSPGATGIRPDPSSFATAVDYLRAIKNSS